MTRVALAWGVHAFTASGAVVGVVALLAIGRGAYAFAALLMLLALLIDAVDGTLARRLRVDEATPDVDGRRLDDIVDYLNYVIVPAVFLVATGILPHWGWSALPVLASAYGFSQSEAKTEDGFFLGFPSYWNVVALYLWLLDVSPTTAVAVVVVLAAAVFVPLKYIYPSQMPVLRRLTNLAGAVWFGCLVTAVARSEEWAWRLTQVSLVFPAYYVAVSLWIGGLRRIRAR